MMLVIVFSSIINLFLSKFGKSKKDKDVILIIYSLTDEAEEEFIDSCSPF